MTNITQYAKWKYRGISWGKITVIYNMMEHTELTTQEVRDKVRVAYNLEKELKI